MSERETKTMTIFSTGYYRINRICLSLCGIWPEQKWLEAYALRVIVWGSMITVIIPEMVYLREVFIGGSLMNDVLPCIPTQMAIICGVLKFFLIALNKTTFQTAIDSMRSDWKLLGDTPAGTLMHQYAARGRFNTIFYMSFLFIAMTLFLVLPMTPIFLDIIMPLNQSRPKNTLFDTDYGVDSDDYFFLITLHGYITSIFLIHILWTVDSFIMIMVQHCCGLFEIVGFTLKQLDSNEMRSEKYEKDVIFQAIEIHQRAISFASSIEVSLRNMYGFVILDNMILISFTGIEAIMNLDRTDQAMRFGSFMIGQMAHLFFNSLPGQQLIDHSGRVFNSVYDCNWDSISIESRKSILMMLMRSRKPSTLTAGGFYELNMENFSDVMQTSLSYLTVLMSLR